MTLPDERYRALLQLEPKLYQLCAEPGPIRKRELRALVRRLMRHFPTGHDIDRMAEMCKGILR